MSFTCHLSIKLIPFFFQRWSKTDNVIFISSGLSVVPVLLNAYARDQGLSIIHRMLAKPLGEFWCQKDPVIDSETIRSISSALCESILSCREHVPITLRYMSYIIKSKVKGFKREKYTVAGGNSLSSTPSGPISPVNVSTSDKLAPLKKRTSVSSKLTSQFSVTDTVWLDDLAGKITGTFLFLRFIIPGWFSNTIQL